MFNSKMSIWKKDKAKEMRRHPTRAEERFWQILKGKKLAGLKFRRQSPMLGYIVDFYCPSIKLVIEVDGSIHERTQARDKHRDEFMNKCGFTVLRFTNDQIFEQLGMVLEKIKAYAYSYRNIPLKTVDTANNRTEISMPLLEQKTLSPQIQPKQKKQKTPKFIIIHGNVNEIIETQHDVYYIDGGTTNNGTPQQASRICVFKNGSLFLEMQIGNKTNNEAEYHALIRALEDIKNKAIIYSDSKLIVQSFIGEWKLKEPRLILLRDQARTLMNKDIAIEWIPREINIAGFYLEELYQI